MTAEQAMYEDLVKELTRREVPFIRRETLEWMRRLLQETEDKLLLTQDDIPVIAEMWEYAFLSPEGRVYEP